MLNMQKLYHEMSLQEKCVWLRRNAQKHLAHTEPELIAFWRDFRADMTKWIPGWDVNPETLAGWYQTMGTVERVAQLRRSL